MKIQNLILIIGEISEMVSFVTFQIKAYGPFPAEKLRKSLKHGSSIPGGMSPVFSGRFPPEESRELVGTR